MPEDRNWTVYIHILKVGPTRVYVGITGRNPEKRWENGTGYINQHRFACAIKSYGFNAFEHFIFASNLTKAEACDMEITLIKRLQEENYHLYNICSGGLGGSARRGKHNSTEHNRKIGDANRGKSRTLTEQQRQAAADRCRNKVSGWRSNPNNLSPFTGRTGKLNNRAHKVYVFDLNWNLLNQFDTISEASEAYKVGSSAISACCRGRLNKTHGYRFSYYKEDPRGLLNI